MRLGLPIVISPNPLNYLKTRLKKVWAKVPIRLVELFRQQEEVMSPLNNFKYYRQVLAENRDKKPIIPYLVVFLR